MQAMTYVDFSADYARQKKAGSDNVPGELSSKITMHLSEAVINNSWLKGFEYHKLCVPCL